MGTEEQKLKKTEYSPGVRNYSRIGIAFLDSKECNSNPAQLPMTCWRGVSHATPGKSQANPSRHSNAARIALELELAELELLKFIVTPSHSKLSTVPTPRHSNAARIARRSDWRNWASPRCHATPRHATARIRLSHCSQVYPQLLTHAQVKRQS